MTTDELARQLREGRMTTAGPIACPFCRATSDGYGHADTQERQLWYIAHLLEHLVGAASK